MSVLTWVVFILSTRLINPHHALCTLSIKVIFFLRKGFFSKHSCWQKLPTHIHPREPSGSVHHCVEPLPFLTKAIGLITETPAAYPQHLYSKFVFNAYCGSHISATQIPFYSSAILKKNTKRHILLIFKPESFPPPNLSSPTEKSTMYTVYQLLQWLFKVILPKFFTPKLPLL